MQPSDTFLMVWAVGASLVASYFYVQFKKAEHHIQMLLQGIADIHDGNAKIIKSGDKITVTYTGGNDGNKSSE